MQCVDTILQAQLLGNDDTNTYPFVIGVDLIQPITTAALIHHCNTVLSHLAPAAALRAPQALVQGMAAQGFQDLVEVLHNGMTAPAPAAPGSMETAVEKCWSANLQTLLTLTQCTSEADLAPAWCAIANAPKKEERHILQAARGDLSRKPGAVTAVTLTISKELHSTIMNLMFWSGDPNRVDEGLHPFRTIYTSTAKTSMDQSNIQTYDLLANDGTLDLQDIKAFQHILKSDWPTTFIQLDTTLKSYHNLLVLLLKATHPYTAAFTRFLNM